MLENYSKLNNGVIKQDNIINQIQDYDVNYVSERYNTYGEKGLQMAYLRLGYLIGVVGTDIDKIMDIGYGNGDFLKVCTDIIPECYGNDISNYPIPDKCKEVDNILEDDFDVVCFFDSLEHFENIKFVSELKTKYIYISLPWCHYTSDDWFKDWKHRREDEHLWHFSDESLTNFMLEMGYKKVDISNVEDVIRKGNNNEQNILSGIFKKI